MAHVISPLKLLDELRKDDIVDGPVTYHQGIVVSINGPVCYVGGPTTNVHPWIEQAIKELDDIEIPIITTGTMKSTPEHPLSLSLRESLDHHYVRELREGVALIYIPRARSWTDQGRGLYAQGARRILKTLIGIHQLYDVPISLGVASEQDVPQGLLYSIRRDCPAILIADNLEQTIHNAKSLLNEPPQN